MMLTKENKAYIDGLSYELLLRNYRFAIPGDEWFLEDTGWYWKTRMAELKALPGGQEKHVAASKRIGW